MSSYTWYILGINHDLKLSAVSKCLLDLFLAPSPFLQGSLRLLHRETTQPGRRLGSLSVTHRDRHGHAGSATVGRAPPGRARRASVTVGPVTVTLTVTAVFKSPRQFNMSA